MAIDERKRLFSLKFEKERTRIESECQKNLLDKQAELGGKVNSGYVQSELIRIQIEKVRKLAETLVSIDTEIYGKPTNEKRVNQIVEKVEQSVNAHIEALLNTLAQNQVIPGNSRQGFKKDIIEEGIGIVASVRRDLLICANERKRKKALNSFCVICWILAFLMFVVLLLDILNKLSMNPERLALLGGIVALIIMPFANKLKILGVEFERLTEKKD